MLLFFLQPCMCIRFVQNPLTAPDSSSAALTLHMLWGRTAGKSPWGQKMMTWELNQLTSVLNPSGSRAEHFLNLLDSKKITDYEFEMIENARISGFREIALRVSTFHFPSSPTHPFFNELLACRLSNLEQRQMWDRWKHHYSLAHRRKDIQQQSEDSSSRAKRDKGL